MVDTGNLEDAQRADYRVHKLEKRKSKYGIGFTYNGTKRAQSDNISIIAAYMLYILYLHFRICETGWNSIFSVSIES